MLYRRAAANAQNPPVFLPSPDAFQRFALFPQQSNPDYLRAEPSTEAEMVIPIVAVRYGPIGAINIETETPSFFDAIDVEEMKRIADLIADVIESRNWLPAHVDELPSIWIPGRCPSSASDIDMSPDAFARSIEHIQQTHDRIGNIPEYSEIRTKTRLLNARYVASLGFADRAIRLLQEVPDFLADPRLQQAIESIQHPTGVRQR